MAQSWRPRPYQRAIVEFIQSHPRCAIWAGMGMGKTSAALTALRAVAPKMRAPALILAPLRVAQHTWSTEPQKWQHTSAMRVIPIIGSAAQRAAALAQKADAYSMNYENIPWLVSHCGGEWPFDAIIADESTRLKGLRSRQGSKRAAALAKVAHRSRYFVELTGTPSPNGLQDLWGQAWFLDKGARLGKSFAAFSARWFQSIPMGGHPAARELRPLPHAQREIQAALSDITLTVQPEDYFDLQEPIVNIVRAPMPRKAMDIYRAVQRELFAQIEGGEIEAVNAAARTTKCLQIASGAVYLENDGAEAVKTGAGRAEKTHWEQVHDAKLEALESIAEETAGAPLLVRYHWQHSAQRILRKFPRARILDKRPQTIADWNDGKIPMLLAHAGSAGHGLNLQDGGRHYVAFDSWWDLEQHQQITERVGPVRQLQSGHPRSVLHYHIIADGTLDEVVLERLQSKRSVQDALLSAMKKEKTS